MFSLSEVVAAVAVSAVAASLQCAGGNLNMNMAFSLLTQQFYMRAAFLSAILIHEWMHLLSAVSAATLAAKPGAVTKTLSAIISPANLRANLSWGAVTQLLIPCLPLPPAFHPHIAIPAIGTRHRQLIYTSIEALGAVGSITAALFVTMSPAFGTPVVISFWICVALSLASDAHFFKPSPAAVKCDASKPSAGRWEAPVWTFFCGNFGLIVACSEGDSGMDIFGVLKAMARICMMRGAQSGGIGALMQHSAGDAKKSVYSFRSRFSAAKRDVLGIKLANMFKRDAFVAKTLKGASATPQNMDYGSFFGHTRFATSSIPLATETHPHQWTPAANIKCTHWSITPAGEWSSTVTTPGVYITHNGDFEFYELFGVERTFGQMQKWLTSVLDSPPPASCDSVGIAGVFEYLRTQGLWPQSLRLAYQQTVAASFDESLPSSAPHADVEGSSPIAPPKWGQLASAGQVLSDAFAAWVAKTSKPGLPEKGVTSAAQRMQQAIANGGGVPALVQHLKAALQPLAAQGNPWLQRVEQSNKWDAFLGATVENFMNNDLYASLRTFFSHGRGSFGMAAVCELDPDRIALAALNQTLSMTFCPDNRSVFYSSEPQVIMINAIESSGGAAVAKEATTNNWREGHPTHRIDVDSREGEAVLLTMKKPNTAWDYDFGWCPFEDGSAAAAADYCRLHVVNLQRDEEITKEAMVGAGRIIALKNNPFIDFPALTAGTAHRDSVAQDLADIPRLLARIHESFTDPSSLNHATVKAFYAQLQEVLERKAKGAAYDPDKKPPIDLLITGVEVSLWSGEQFASDLRTMFPTLGAIAISSNKVIGVIGNARGTVAPTGFDFTLGEGSLDPTHTIALCISHSGQTFPTMHATKILQAALPGRVFVLSGSYDTQMGLAVGHQLQAGAPFCNRMFSTFAGWRGAEPPSVTVAGVHHTLTSILVYCADACNKTNPKYASLSVQEMHELQSIVDVFSTKSVGSILGVDQLGNPVQSEIHEQLKRQGRQWSWHILEGVIAWIVAAAYIFGTVIAGYPLFYGIGRGAGLAPHASASYVLRTFDAALYVWIWHITCLVLRLLTGRPLMARFGKRTLVIADVPYVNQTLETYVSKLFALSFGIASIEVHGANTADHFVHRFTHRVARGVLIAAGRPDGRMCSQTTTESSVLLALTQAHVIRSLSCPPEILTIGHNPYFNATAMDHSIVLPSNRHRFLCEAIMSAKDGSILEPSQRLAKIASILDDCEHASAENEAALVDTISAWAAKPEAEDGAEYFVGVDGLHKPQILSLAKAGAHRCGDPLCYLRLLGAIPASTVDEKDTAGNGGLDETVQDQLEAQSDVEQLVEARCLSLERLLAFEVMFHSMAARVADFWPLNFDVSRSQSGLRICTTAGPVSASDLQREYEETLDFYERRKEFKEYEVSMRSLTHHKSRTGTSFRAS